ncbi:unnamed protein product [Porites lobata]|uniref:Uncharacterized protein n=1 Tax=Porites lobata TaxID=104759 RepID=A0ABN8NB21_9CNID|nr:unnamed protein product [Porites lobata]
MGCLDSLQPLHQECGQKHGKPGLPRSWLGLPGKHGLEKPGKPSQGQGFKIEITVLFVANSQWNTLKTVCSGATRL